MAADLRTCSSALGDSSWGEICPPLPLSDCPVLMTDFCVEFCSGEDAYFNKTLTHKQPCEGVVLEQE